MQDDLLRILGEKHRLYDFLSTLSVKSSYLLFNKEHVKELLLEVATQKSTENSLRTSSCMNILVVRPHHFCSFCIVLGFFIDICLLCSSSYPLNIPWLRSSILCTFVIFSVHLLLAMFNLYTCLWLVIVYST